ncbi:hypothetical protein HYH03_009702 [Edaphochlamys debaryana]|uniref:Uncharacterized protein n=1 Tax=Edaphochlamys debaryana TaxID=47281 RepID=A0A835XXF3_9CHLO|nr:hypothetical protein HYH03_009702 [Edaphochlamys debaryana]|eukprot:KAG2491971.1 hypothetical protein HYH03_009702 [Edaphochlamys debaryana]
MELGDSLAPPWLRRCARGTAESTSPTEQAPEAASGPPLTPAQRRLLVAAGAGIPERLLSSRPSQQAQAHVQQPVRGAWRAGATYRPALRAAATAALSAAAPEPSAAAVNVPAALSAESWRKARSDWRDFQTAVHNLWLAKKSLISRGKRGDADSSAAKAAYERLVERAHLINASARYSLAESLVDSARQAHAPGRASGASSGDLPPSLLLGAWDDAPMWVGSEEQLLTGRAALLCAICTAIFVGVFLPSPQKADGLWMSPPEGRRSLGIKAALALAQALLQRSGCPSPTQPQLRTFAFLVTALMSHAAKKPGLVQALAAATPGPLAALTSVPALAKLARATADTVDAATPNTELLMLPTDQYKLAKTVVEAYCRAVMQAARDAGLQAESSGSGPAEEPGTPPPEASSDGRAEGYAGHSPDGLAEAVEAACASWLADSGHARTQEAVDADSQTGCKAREKADAECLKCTEQVLQALRPGGAHGSVNAKGDVSPKVWLAMHKARQGASELRLAVLRARLGSWLPAEMGCIARAVCRPVAVSSAGEAGAGESTAAAQPGGAREEVEELRLESSQLASPSTRAALARALVAAHLDKRPTRVALCDVGAFTFLASAAALLGAARTQLWRQMQLQAASSVGLGRPAVMPRLEDCGCFPGLLLRPTRRHRAPAVDGAGLESGERGVGDGCNGRGTMDAALEVELVPLSLEQPGSVNKVFVVEADDRPNGLYFDRISRSLLERLGSHGMAWVAPAPGYSLRALESMLVVCDKTLAVLRAAGREAVLLPVVLDVRGCEASTNLSRAQVLASVSMAGGREPVGLRPNWAQRLRMALTCGISTMLRDGCVAYDDEPGGLHKVARVAVGDADSLDSHLNGHLASRVGASGMTSKSTTREAGALLNEQLHEALDAELDVRQMGRHGVFYWLVEVDPANLNSPVVLGRVQEQGTDGEEEASAEMGNGWHWGDEDGASLMDELD